jgi:hypothetical protein
VVVAGTSIFDEPVSTRTSIICEGQEVVCFRYRDGQKFMQVHAMRRATYLPFKFQLSEVSGKIRDELCQDLRASFVGATGWGYIVVWPHNPAFPLTARMNPDGSYQ